MDEIWNDETKTADKDRSRLELVRFDLSVAVLTAGTSFARMTPQNVIALHHVREDELDALKARLARHLPHSVAVSTHLDLEWI
ncbi:hypothetical protein E2C01_059995 [Portunus trituberculatus]|uniref:Uncharacterized protein n=1 Tax=Portunus trituberculatus TaxID=210409 RepID=A0A5B7HA58_PORTR|nr:hypothetical protein [Portunus trituberculatus]